MAGEFSCCDSSHLERALMRFTLTVRYPPRPDGRAPDNQGQRDEHDLDSMRLELGQLARDLDELVVGERITVERIPDRPPPDPRVFDEQRRAQGFRSQAHLDAFYAAYDHVATCPDCGNPGPAMWLEGSASWQPTETRCPVARGLDSACAALGVQPST